MTEKPKVGILTAFRDLSPAYSLTGLVKDQARSLKENDYDYAILAWAGFNRRDKEEVLKEGLSLRDVLSPGDLQVYAAHERERPEFKEQVENFYRGGEEGLGIKEAVEPYDIIITHDLMFLDCYLAVNQAIRKCISAYPKKRWLHWFHSGPSRRPEICDTVLDKNGKIRDPKNDVEKGYMCYPSTLRYTVAPNSLYAFPNKSKRQEVANMLLTDNSSIRVVHNTRDIRDVLNFHPDTRDFIKAYKLFDHFILQTYSFSTPRWRDKGVHKVMKIFGEWKKAGIPAKLVLVNAHCTSEDNDKQVDEIKAFAAKECSLSMGEEVILTSDYANEKAAEYKSSYPPAEEDPLVGTGKWAEWKYSVPYKVVMDLMAMSNMFIFPSLSETCSLIQGEASILGKFMVLNGDFYPMLEISTDDVLHFQFSQNDPVDNSAYYECAAREIISNFINDSSVMNATKARNEIFNREWTFKNQLEPILYERLENAKP